MLATGAMSRMKLKLRLLVERRVDGVGRGYREQRVAVGRRAHHRLGADIAAGAGLIFDDEGLAEPLGEELAHQPHDDVLRAAGGKADDQVHRPRRIIERPGANRKSGRSDGGGAGKLQKLAAAKSHGVSPLRHYFFVTAGAAKSSRLVLAPTGGCHCSLMSASWITLAHFWVSATIRLLKAAGDIGAGAVPRLARRVLISASPSAALIALLS